MSRKKTSHSPAQRRSEIARLASTIGLASVEELWERYGVTSSTIRRDLSRLEAAGLIARTYGGAIFISDENESPLQERQGEFFAAKRAIASWAAQRIKDHERVLFDGGSTVGALAATLGKRDSLRVTAMGVNAINSLIDRDDIELSSQAESFARLAKASSDLALKQHYSAKLLTAPFSRRWCDRAVWAL